MSIKAESKTKLMDQIGTYYIKILEEFFIANSGSKSQHSRSTDSQASEFHFGDMMQQRHSQYKEDNPLRTVFEKVINELRNIEYALNYWISISQKNKRKRFSRI